MILLKKKYLYFFFMFFMMCSAIAQTPCKKMLASAKKEKNYQKAIAKINAVRHCDPSLSKECDALTLKIFKQIENLKNKAIKAEKEARIAERNAKESESKAIANFKLAETEREISEKALKKANKNEEMTYQNIATFFSYIDKTQQTEVYTEWLNKTGNISKIKPVLLQSLSQLEEDWPVATGLKILIQKNVLDSGTLSTVFGIWGIACKETSESEYSLLRDRAVSYYENDNKSLAILNSVKLVRKFPNKIKSYLMAALCFNKFEKADSAIVYINKGLKLNSNYLPLLNELVISYKAKKDYKKAISQIKKNIKIKGEPKLRDYEEMAGLYTNNEDYKKAIEFYTKVIDKDINNKYAYGSIGYCYRQLGEYDKAITYLNKRLSFDDNSIWTLKQLSYIYSNQKNYLKAEEYTKKAIEINRKYNSLWYNLSFYSLFINKPEQAIIAAHTTMSLNPQAVSVVSNLANGYLLDNQWSKAKMIYLEWKNKHFPNDKRLCQEIFLKDIKELEEAGVHHPNFKKAKQLLKE